MFQKNQIIEELFEKFGPEMGVDYQRYKNHVYRVFLNCLLIDGNNMNEDLYAIAAVFHDIGIWTDRTIDYIDPSIIQAELYLTETGKEDLIDEVSMMIFWHHKVTDYKGAHQKIVETFRRADWIDVSRGLRRFGLPRARLASVFAAWPNAGFHKRLIQLSLTRLRTHPFAPLPMMRL